ncbi:hypothetical protein HDU91_004386, partial [Kappamyces sp. JEL0680]
MFESRSQPQTDPLVLWLNGGPGCSSFTGLLMELGPCTVDRGSRSTTLNPYSWNSNASVIFLDQPIGTGFSYGKRKDRSSAQAAEGVYNFLRLFLHSYPAYRGLSFHLTGESYAGHYLPEIGQMISKGNQKSADDAINLVSIAIGNGITNSLIQNQYYPDMAADPKYGPILSEHQIRRMREAYPKCQRLDEACYRDGTKKTCRKASRICSDIMFEDFDRLGISSYDIRVSADAYKQREKTFEKWLNRPKIRAIMGTE